MNKSDLPDKKLVANGLLLYGSVFVHLDPRRPGVLVPARLRNQAQVVLQIGLDMPVPIPDLRVDEEGIFGTLSFKGIPFSCFVPWDGVFALVGEDAKGMVWSKEMPSEVKEQWLMQARSPQREEQPGNVVSLEKWRAARTSRR